MESKKVLIITYYWPPAGGPGVQRSLKFAKYLRDYGWEPIILTVNNGEYPATDYSLEKEIPEGIKIYKTKTIEPFNIYKKISGKKNIDTYVLSNKEGGLFSKVSKWIRLNIFIPDGRIGWLPFAVKTGKKIIKENNIDVIFTTSPPHSTHLIGNKLAKKTGLTWVSDFRDPWNDLVVLQSQKILSATRRINERLERKVLKNSDAVITVSDSIRDDLKIKANKEEVFTILNGHDNSNIIPLEDINNEIFTITYAGVLSETRIPYPLLYALKGINNVKLQIIGNICEKLTSLIKELGIENKVSHLPYMSKKELNKYYNNSNAFLFVIDNVPNNKGVVTGKLFDYMSFKRPIIGIGPLDGDACKIINSSNCGEMFDYKDNENIKSLIENLISTSNTRKFSFEGIEKYSRKGQTKELVDIFNSLL